MKKYIKPNLETTYFESADIIKTSGVLTNDPQNFNVNGVNAGTIDFNDLSSLTNEANMMQ